jgi:transcriptional regulator with XRE-family HTH domain
MSKNNIRKIITDRGLTVPEAARLCGLPVPTVSAHYYGQRKSMTLQIAAKYAQGLEVSMDDLLSKGGSAA